MLPPEPVSAPHLFRGGGNSGRAQEGQFRKIPRASTRYECKHLLPTSREENWELCFLSSEGKKKHHHI